jgi:hypothetical protein
MLIYNLKIKQCFDGVSMHKEITLKCILCHIHPILGNDGEKTRQHARQWPKNTTKELCSLRGPKARMSCNRGTMFSVRSVPSLYNQVRLRLRDSLIRQFSGNQ